MTPVPDTADDPADKNKDGYTNVEEWLNSFAVGLWPLR